MVAGVAVVVVTVSGIQGTITATHSAVFVGGSLGRLQPHSVPVQLKNELLGTIQILRSGIQKWVHVPPQTPAVVVVVVDVVVSLQSVV